MVRIARSALSGFFFLAFGVGSVLLGFLLFPILLVVGRGPRGRRRMRACVRASYRLFVWAARVTGLFRVDVSPEDMRQIASARGRIVVANHISLIDVVILMAFLPDSTAVAKAAAGRNPFYSRIVSSVFLVNDDPMGVLSSASELLSAGTNIVIFPEGTRTPPGTPRRLHRGAAQMAIHSGVPIMCMSIACSPSVLAKGQPWWDVGSRVIHYSLRALGEIVPPKIKSDAISHAAAVSLTNDIESRLWP